MCNGKSDKDYIQIKLRRYPMSSMSDLYEFKISFFDHGCPEEFLLFVHNFNMTLEATRMQDMDANIQYLCTLVSG